MRTLRGFILASYGDNYEGTMFIQSDSIHEANEKFIGFMWPGLDTDNDEYAKCTSIATQSLVGRAELYIPDNYQIKWGTDITPDNAYIVEAGDNQHWPPVQSSNFLEEYHNKQYHLELVPVGNKPQVFTSYNYPKWKGKVYSFILTSSHA